MKSWGTYAVLSLSLAACEPLLLSAEPFPTGGHGTTAGNGVSQRADYLESSSDVPNVERGLLVEWDGANGSLTLAQGQPLVLYKVDWGTLCNSSLGTNATNSLTQDFATLRANGTKAVLAISYAQSSSLNICGYYDADSVSTILGQLNALGPILTANADVIAFVEAGLLGHYGLWSTTGNPGGEPIVATDPNTRLSVLQGLLAAVPANRRILIPDPNFRSVVANASGFSASALARIGYQDAGFLATATDNGTYASAAALTAVEAVIAQNSNTVPFGAETSGGDANNRFSCAAAIAEMTTVGTTYFSISPQSIGYTTWKNGGCLQEITNRLGYRFVVENTSYSTGPVTPGGTVTALVTITNNGFAPMYNPHQASLVLIDANGNIAPGLTSVTSENADVTQWMPGQTVVFSQTLQLPAGIAAGTWFYALSMPDPSGNPAFAVQLASDAPGYADPMFSTTGGYNQLRISVSVQ